jgi:hypothetical protein
MKTKCTKIAIKSSKWPHIVPNGNKSIKNFHSYVNVPTFGYEDTPSGNPVTYALSGLELAKFCSWDGCSDQGDQIGRIFAHLGDFLLGAVF